MKNTDDHEQPRTTIDNHRQPQTTTDNHRQPQTTTGNHGQPRTKKEAAEGHAVTGCIYAVDSRN
ncbi:MAG: hypothetical protein NTY46_08340 [Candidatus Sumerlaeota bacterium]|nr:hypothetical protein [Candidatus Sumerlaeota bacterium]